MDGIRPNRSIIQSTLFNILISVFVLSLILISLFGRSFWEKESIKLDYELLNAAIKVKEKIAAYYHSHLEGDEHFLKSLTTYQVRDIKPLLTTNKPYTVVYYDIRSRQIITEKEEIELSVEEVLDTLGDNLEIQQLKHSDYSLVSIPVIQDNVHLGYIWAYCPYPEINNKNAFPSYHLFFILIFLLLGTVIILIQKHMKNIQTQLEEFTVSIVHPESQRIWDFKKLPELEPVFNKIMGYTQELTSINEELYTSQQRINQILEGISDGLFSIDQEWRLLFYNDVAKKYFNQSDEELIMKNVLDIFPGLSHRLTHQYIAEAMINPEPIYFEAEGIIMPGRFHQISIYPFEGGITLFFRDITGLRQQQNEMARLERLNLVGQMAAGISHEIRNPLTTVKGFLQLRGSKVTDPEEKEYNELMISEIDRANTIISEFLSLAKNNVDRTKEQDINQIVYRIFPIIQADAHNGHKELILNLNPLPSLLLNENEIRQLILNLVRNALEVTPQGGCVIIRSYEERNHIVLAVQDQGCGIPEEIRNKIGTPFFTTKESGTGLGIAISMGIAHRHNAKLVFDTGDQGTTFKVMFKRRNKPEKKAQ